MYTFKNCSLINIGIKGIIIQYIYTTTIYLKNRMLATLFAVLRISDVFIKTSKYIKTSKFNWKLTIKELFFNIFSL